jgi:hypothetical protein
MPYCGASPHPAAHFTLRNFGLGTDGASLRMTLPLVFPIDGETTVFDLGRLVNFK